MTEEKKPFIKPEEFKLADADGKEYIYILSNFPAVAGRKIISQYPLTGLPKFGDYVENEKLMIELMSYVAVKMSDGREQRLETQALIDNHVPGPEMLVKIEMKMMEKNFSFFRDGRSLNFFDSIAQLLTKKITETLTLSLQPLSEQDTPPSMS